MKVKYFPNHEVHKSALISVSLALCWTSVYIARQEIRWD